MEGLTFSIREYASRVRSIDVVKCWPFDGTVNEEKVKSLLPPITIKKFSWWVDELQDFHNKESAQNLEEVVKVKSLKGKSKAPKKRSIVEIFAVAPQVERVNSRGSDEEYEDENGVFNSKWSVKGKRSKKKNKKKKKKSKDVILSKGKQVIKKIKKRKAYNGVNSLSSLSNKGKHSKFKAQSQGKATERLKSSYSEESEHDVSDCPTLHKRRSNTDRKTASKVFNLIEKSKIPALPKSNSLRKLASGFSREQSAECILQETIKVNDRYGKQKTANHVTFSHDEDTVSLTRKPSLSAECRKLQKISRLSTRDADHEGDIGKDSTDMKRVENEMGTFSRNVISDIRELQGIHAEMFDTSLREAPLDQIYACPPEEYYNRPSIRFKGNSESSTSGIRDPRPSPVCFKDYLENNDGPSFSYLSYLERAANIMPQVSSPSSALNGSPSQCQTFSYLSPKEVLPAFSSEHVLQKRVITGINKDFIGLPLNSHGELIDLSSSGKESIDQMKSSITLAPSTSLSMPRDYFSKGFVNPSQCEILDRRIFSKDQLYSFPFEAYAKENPVFVYPPTEDFTESQSSGVTNLDMDLIKNDDHSFHSQKSVGKEDRRVQTSPGTEKSQSTMRLMGKDFIVGGKSFQELEDVHTWKDKQILDEFQYHNKSISNLLIHNWKEPSLGKLKETLFYPSENAFNHSLGSRCTVPHFGYGTSSMNPAAKVYPSFSPGTVSAVCNSDSLFRDPSRSGYESHLLSSTAIELKNKQNLPHAKKSAFRFPFMHPDLDGHVQFSCSHVSAVNQSPLFFEASEKKTSKRDFQAYCNMGSYHLTISPLSRKPEVVSLHDPLSSGSTLQSSVAPASLPQIPLTQHALMPVYPKVVPISSIQETHANPKTRDRIKSKIGIRGAHHAKKAKRQVSAVSNHLSKSFKVLSLGSQEVSQRAITKSTTHVNIEGCVQNNERAFESCSDIDTSKIIAWEEQRVCPWTDSHNDVARSGPTKLTAGAKHILKACQQIDQSSSISTYPGIPFGETSTGFKRLESENSKKIYMF